MIKLKTKISIEDFAKGLASSDHEQQAKFFNIFFKALHSRCKTDYKFNTQKAYISVEVPERVRGSGTSTKLLGGEEKQ